MGSIYPIGPEGVEESRLLQPLLPDDKNSETETEQEAEAKEELRVSDNPSSLKLILHECIPFSLTIFKSNAISTLSR